MKDQICVISENQDITGADEISASIIDLEQNGVTDEQMFCWLNMIVNDANFTGLTEGIRVTFRTADNIDMTTSPMDVVDSGVILPARLTEGATFSWGICAASLKRWFGAFYDVVSTAATGTLNVTVTLDYAPITPKNHSLQRDLY